MDVQKGTLDPIEWNNSLYVSMDKTQVYDYNRSSIDATILKFNGMKIHFNVLAKCVGTCH